MAKEVERKFLVTNDGWRAAARHGASIRQFYVMIARDRTARLRIRNGEKAELTLKFGSNQRERDEFETEIDLNEALEMERFALGTVIEKTRYLVDHAGHTFELDVFAGALDGLIVAELETPDDVPDRHLPPWLGREVTGESAWYNASLALNGRPEKAA